MLPVAHVGFATEVVKQPRRKGPNETNYTQPSLVAHHTCAARATSVTALNRNVTSVTLV